MATTYLSKTFAQAGNRRTFTISYWIKMGVVSTGADQAIMGAAQDGSNSDDLYIHTGRLNFSGYYGSTAYQVRTTAKYRDLSGWYHHVIRFDSTQSTASDRLRLYVNGELQTALDSNTYPSQNLETTYFNTARQHTIGSIAYGVPNLPFNGSMSHFHFCDGYSYGADSFGETDSTTGEWKINTNPSVTYGTNGFFILKDGNSVTDQSGQGNNWSVGGGTLTKTEDCPSNVFATLNPLIPMRGTPTYQSGNTYFRSDYTNWDSALSTIGATSGKWYFEAKWGGQDNLMIGCVDVDKDPEFLSAQGTYGYLGHKGISYFGQSSNAKVIGNGNQDLYTGLTSFAQNDIIGCAIDLDNREMFVHKNGTYTNSGNPATRANPYDMSTSINQGGHVLIGVASRSGYGVEVNFGNGYFSSTAVSSAGTNASGIGIFEYDVPTGYTALSTKGLNL